MTATRKIGELEVSVAGLGCNTFGWAIDAPTAEAIVHTALDLGVNHFDTADVYGSGASEEHLGRALGSRRDEVVIATKFGTDAPEGLTGGHPDSAAQAVEGSLARLGTDRIDLYWLHRPDPDTPIGDTLGALSALVEAGKVREIGCSNFSAAMLDEAARAAADLGLRPFAAVQNEYSLLVRDAETDALPACERLGLAFVPFFPLASGALSGKYRRGEEPTSGRLSRAKPLRDKYLTDDNMALVDQLQAFAAERGHTLLELAISWLVANPAVASVITGATSPEQVRANVAAIGAWELSADDQAALDALLASSG